MNENETYSKPMQEAPLTAEETANNPSAASTRGGTTQASSAKESAGAGVSFKHIIGGDFLTHDFFRRQIKLLVLLVVMSIIYISNRYSYQQEMIEIDRLKKELTDIRYDALTRSSELTEKSRQSHIEEYVSTEESALQTATHPPYLIK